MTIHLARADEVSKLVALTSAAFDETRALGLPSSALKEDESAWSSLRAIEGQVRGAALVLKADPPDEDGLLASVRIRFDGAVRVAQLESAAAGLPASESLVNTVVFERLAVAPQHRGQGHATSLVYATIELATCLGASEVRADARSERPDSRPFYTRLGFEIVGSTDCYGIRGLRTRMRLVLL